MFRFKECRENANLTQKEAAFSLGVSVQSISNWENEVRRPSLEQLLKIADLYHVTIDDLLGRPPMKVVPLEGEPPEQMEGYHHIVFELDEQPDPNDMEALIRKILSEELKKRGL